MLPRMQAKDLFLLCACVLILIHSTVYMFPDADGVAHA